MGALSFAQARKTNALIKAASRKVLTNDIKNIPPEAKPEIQSGQINGDYPQKIKSKQYIQINQQKELKIC